MRSLRLVCAGLQLAQGECGWNRTEGYRGGGRGAVTGKEGRDMFKVGGSWHSQVAQLKLVFIDDVGHFVIAGDFLPERESERERERVGSERERAEGRRGGVRTARAVGSACNWAHAGSCELMTSRVQAKAAPARIISWGRLPPNPVPSPHPPATYSSPPLEPSWSGTLHHYLLQLPRRMGWSQTRKLPACLPAACCCCLLQCPSPPHSSGQRADMLISQCSCHGWAQLGVGGHSS